ncbi:patatin-like phospholipase family protein [Massilia niastensis]|uniref:patatin-like phospholipase family protein n=1 Tax=Massilia niastensis TaxID=544911 RepID=UPI0003A0439F|nr:patatin-like phospholipase family protein [Massilia niastensis]
MSRLLGMWRGYLEENRPGAPDNIRSAIRTLACLFLLVTLSACVTKYPKSEPPIGLEFPLDECSDSVLTRVGKDVKAPKSREKIDPTSLCVTAPIGEVAQPGTNKEERREIEARAFSGAEAVLRGKLEPPFAAGAAAPRFGLALSGGGSKASAFTVGVMAGLSDHDLLDRADFISTVSGGGYAAYFYYAHRIFPVVRPGHGTTPDTAALYNDCIGMPDRVIATCTVIAAIGKVNHCPRLGLVPNPANDDVAQTIRYQAFLRCTQDVLQPGECDTRTTRGFDWGISKISLLGSISLFPLSNISNTLFDWGLSTSPSGRTYHDGIGISNGATVSRPSAFPKGIEQSRSFCDSASVKASEMLDCKPNVFDPDPAPMSFDELRSGLQKLNRVAGRRIPFWIINATAPKHRSAYGWLVKARKDTSNNDMFEMTAVSHGSGRYGYVSAPVSIYDMTVLDAVAASAAFFDSNQLVYQNRLGKSIVALLMHVGNLDWGYDIPNYNVSIDRRRLHRALPVPLYYVDGYTATMSEKTDEMRDRRRSVYIRLIDGGNSENLGVYSLIKRKTRNILISDAAEDKDGRFGDICGLRKRLQWAPKEWPRYLYVPGLADFEEHCDKNEKGKGYDVYRWFIKQPVLFGCVRRHETRGTAAEACRHLGKEDVRLFIVKPAINYHYFVQEQVIMEGDAPKVARCNVRTGAEKWEQGLLDCEAAVFLVANKKYRSRDACPIFPQHETALMTANSSSTMFAAYRALARQYAGGVAELLKAAVDREEKSAVEFENVAAEQGRNPIPRSHFACPEI